MSKRKTTEEFIIDAIRIHGYKYDYSLVEYISANKKIKIICPEHGVFEQVPYSHLKGNGCRKCYTELKSKTKEYYFNEFNKTHKNKYDYSLINDNKLRNKQKIKIICPEHGIFEQKVESHILGYGCNHCSKKIKKTNKMFNQEADIVHNFVYDYSLVDYKNNYTKIKIICPIHGIFEQLPRNHVSSKHGCPKCNISKGESTILRYLSNNKIYFIKEKVFNNCKDNSFLRFDFYLPDYNLCIEYDGVQHFKSIDYWNGEDGLKNNKKRDKIKNDYCKNNNINLLRIRYDENIEEKLNNYFNLNH